MTETALADLLAAPLGNLDLVALMIDGVHFGEHLCVVALGIGIDGTKHPLGLVEGSTENTTVVTGLLADLRERGLDTTRPILVGIDGGKALHAGIMAVLDHPVIQDSGHGEKIHTAREGHRHPHSGRAGFYRCRSTACWVSSRVVKANRGHRFSPPSSQRCSHMRLYIQHPGRAKTVARQ
jgi:hypothetical protein